MSCVIRFKGSGLLHYLCLGYKILSIYTIGAGILLTEEPNRHRRLRPDEAPSALMPIAGEFKT